MNRQGFIGKGAFTHSRIVKIKRAACKFLPVLWTGERGGRMSSERAAVSAFTQAKNTGCSPAQQHNCSLRL